MGNLLSHYCHISLESGVNSTVGFMPESHYVIQLQFWYLGVNWHFNYPLFHTIYLTAIKRGAFFLASSFLGRLTYSTPSL